MIKNIPALVADYESLHGAISPGETVRMDHKDCPAGEDTRGRLYITPKMADGKVAYLAYCHNCGDGGAMRYAAALCRAAPRSLGAAPQNEISLPPGCVSVFAPEVPAEATAWVSPYMSLQDAGSLCISWDHESQRVVLPVWPSVDRDWVTGGLQIVGPLRGYQLRRIFGTRGPKYLSARGSEELEMIFRGHPVPTPGGRPAVCLVEDWLSAWWLAKHHAIAVVPLLGVHVRPERLANLVRQYPRVVVWLDNDNDTVRAHAEHLTRLALAMGAKATSVTGYGQPKDLTGNEVAIVARQAYESVTA